MRIGELARRASVSRDTIRFYERNGLISSEPAEGGTNNYRDYREDTIVTLQLIQEAQAAGFTISEMRAFMSVLNNALDSEFDAEAFIESKIAEVEWTIRRSRKFLKTLKETRNFLSRSH